MVFSNAGKTDWPLRVIAVIIGYRYLRSLKTFYKIKRLEFA